MRQNNSRLWVLGVLLVLSHLGAMGCAKKSESPAATPPIGNGTGYVPPSVGPGQDPGTIYGATASISLAGGSLAEQMALLGEYTGRPMNSVNNLKINLNVTQTSTNTYGGTVRITYEEYGYQREGYFTSGQGVNETQFNKWFTSNGSPIWHGVFEDLRHAYNLGGGIAIVIDQVIDLGDGGGPEDLVNGTIWFKNFTYTNAPHPPTYCWFVSLGPYDCRPWPSGTSMNTTQSVNPTGGYKLLGRFYGLSLKKAFNIEQPYQGI